MESGNIVVFTGIIPVAKDEDGLAAILGHGSSSRFGVARLNTKLRYRDRTCRSTAQCGEIFIYESPPSNCHPVGSVGSRLRNRQAPDNIPH